MTLALWFCGAGALTVIVFGVLSALTGKRYKFRDGAVQGVTGVMGAGKSVFTIARVLLPAAKAITSKHGLWSTSGRRVERLITNFDVDLPYPVEVVRIEGEDLWEQLYELSVLYADRDDQGAFVLDRRGQIKPRLNAVVLIDECDLYIGSDRMRAPARARWLMKMMRKLNAEFWWICQYENQVHVSVRRHTSICWSMRHSAPLWTLFTGTASRWFVGEGWSVLNGTVHRYKAKPLQTVRYRRSRTVDKAYDSFELIVPLDEENVRMTRRAVASAVPLSAVPDWPTPAELVDEDQADELAEL